MATMVEKLHDKMIMTERDVQVHPAAISPDIGIFSIPDGNMAGNIHPYYSSLNIDWL